MLEVIKQYSQKEEFQNSLGIPSGTELEFRMLAQGEYNMNYLFTHPVTEQQLLLRINMGSQMHLENQI